MTGKRDALESALLDAMDRAYKVPMAWGTDDCVLWCADVLREALGYDAAAHARGRYRTRIGAGRVLGKGGLPAALRATARRQGWRRIKPGAEQVGDVGLLQVGRSVSTVICRAPGWFVARNDSGFTAVRTLDAAGAPVIRIIWAVV